MFALGCSQPNFFRLGHFFFVNERTNLTREGVVSVRKARVSGFVSLLNCAVGNNVFCSSIFENNICIEMFACPLNVCRFAGVVRVFCFVL